jgi:hypothetical protein
MSGDPKLAAIKPMIATMKFPNLLPPDSKAHLLRSAVLFAGQYLPGGPRARWRVAN